MTIIFESESEYLLSKGLANGFHSDGRYTIHAAVIGRTELSRWCINPQLWSWTEVSRSGLAVSVRLVSRGTSVWIRFGSPSSSQIVVCGHCLNCDFVLHN